MSALRSRAEISNDRRPHFMVLLALPEAKVTQASSLTRSGHAKAGKPASRNSQDGCVTQRPVLLIPRHFLAQQRERILRCSAFGIVVKVDVHVAVFL